MPNQEPMIKVQDVRFRYDPEQPKYAVDGVSLDIRRGEFVAVLGANGCGKSTLAKHFNAILLPEAGTVLVEGMDTRNEDHLYDVRQKVGMVFQNPDNQIVATIVEEDVAFAPENLGVPPEEIRTRIDAVDDQLLKLFLERMELAEEVAAYKNEHHLPILNKQREREILAKVTARAGDKERYAYHLYSTLFELARSRQAELVDLPTRVAERVEKSLAAGGPVFPQTGLVACQGVEGANSQVACDRLLPRGSILYVKTFDAVVSAVESGLCKFGVLPIENSSNGSVRAVYSLLQQHQLSVVRSTRLCIRHELLAMPGVKLKDITEIYSHQQAIGQCSRFLSSLSGVRVIPCGNTAEAAKLVAESGSRHAAAISSHPCAALYGLECVSDKIQDSENNYTRFFCVAKDPVIYAGANRISLILSFENKPGALYEILSKLAALDINMTKLESCPVAGSDFEFVFFLELEASVQDPSVLAMLEEMERSCAEFVFLGNYAEV